MTFKSISLNTILSFFTHAKVLLLADFLGSVCCWGVTLVELLSSEPERVSSSARRSDSLEREFARVDANLRLKSLSLYLSPMSCLEALL